jgi:hypothetical protein
MAQDVQQVIVRQSQLKQATEYYALVGYKPTLKELIGLANLLSDYCINGYSKEMSPKLSQIDKILKIK